MRASALAHAAEQQVALYVAEAVVVGLEAVEIAQQEDAAVAAGSPQHRRVEVAQQLAPVGEPGEGVMVRLDLQVLPAAAGGRTPDPVEPVEHRDQDQRREQQADGHAEVATEGRPARGLAVLPEDRPEPVVEAIEARIDLAAVQRLALGDAPAFEQ